MQQDTGSACSKEILSVCTTVSPIFPYRHVVTSQGNTGLISSPHAVGRIKDAGFREGHRLPSKPTGSPGLFEGYIRS